MAYVRFCPMPTNMDFWRENSANGCVLTLRLANVNTLVGSFITSVGSSDFLLKLTSIWASILN